MKFMQLEIKTETADEMAKVLLNVIPLVNEMELEYQVSYKDSEVEENVRRMLAEHLSDPKFIAEEITNT